MEKYVGLNPAWFEPGADGESPFIRKYNASPGTAGEAISAAFRALLAEDEQATSVDCGNIVQVPEAVSPNVAELIRAKDNEITKLRDEVERLTVELRACKDERMAAEIERDAADEFVKRLTAEPDTLRTRIKVLEVANDSLTQYSSNLTAERDALQASLRDEQAKRASIEAELAACRESRDAGQATVERLNEHNINLQADLSTAKRDIAAINSYWAEADAKAKELQARIDGGVRVWGDYLVWGQLEEHDTHTGIVIDVEKIRPDVVEMADERKGEEVVNSTGIQYRGHWLPFHNRRCTTGTRADRRQA